MKLIETMERKVVELQVKLDAIARDERGGAGPYVLAWFLGVPASILAIIYLLKHSH